MEDINNEMINMLTQKIGTMFNPLIQETHTSYQALTNQMGRIADFFGAPLVQNTLMPQNYNPRPIQIPAERPNNGVYKPNTTICCQTTTTRRV